MNSKIVTDEDGHPSLRIARLSQKVRAEIVSRIPSCKTDILIMSYSPQIETIEAFEERVNKTSYNFKKVNVFCSLEWEVFDGIPYAIFVAYPTDTIELTFKFESCKAWCFINFHDSPFDNEIEA